MRLDKYLKVSRLIKRRTVANDACDAGRVMINGKVAYLSDKANTEIYTIAYTRSPPGALPILKGALVSGTGCRS